MLNDKNQCRLDHIRKSREKFFSKPLLKKYIFEFVSKSEFREFRSKNFMKHAPLMLIFVPEQLRSENEITKLNVLNEGNEQFLLEDNLLIKDPETNMIVAIFRGHQETADSYYMQISAVHQEYRRKGIYTALLDIILQYTHELGFCRVTSKHLQNNNAILIAKLKKDFKLMGCIVDPSFGTVAQLCYFHNQELKSAFDLRCDYNTFNGKLYDASLGTAEVLYKNIESSRKKRCSLKQFISRIIRFLNCKK
jgi:GNAT superfamily N-acetyltransferase